MWGSPDEGFIPPPCRPTSPASCAPSDTTSTCISSRSPQSPKRWASGSSCPSTATGWRTTPTPRPTSPSSSAAAAAPATATTATRRSTARCAKLELLELSDPTKAAAAWASIDRQLTNDAVWVPTVTDARRRTHLPPPAQLPIQPRLGFPRRPELAPIADEDGAACLRAKPRFKAHGGRSLFASPLQSWWMGAGKGSAEIRCYVRVVGPAGSLRTDGVSSAPRFAMARRLPAQIKVRWVPRTADIGPTRTRPTARMRPGRPGKSLGTAYHRVCVLAPPLSTGLRRHRSPLAQTTGLRSGIKDQAPE